VTPAVEVVYNRPTVSHLDGRWAAVVGAIMGLALGVACSGGDQSSDAGPPVTDIFTSPECRDFCKRLETACPDTKCDPMADCNADGDCLAAKRRELACKANPSSSELTCEHPGYSLVSGCLIPKGLCP
jgi:hypothetical protein